MAEDKPAGDDNILDVELEPEEAVAPGSILEVDLDAEEEPGQAPQGAKAGQAGETPAPSPAPAKEGELPPVGPELPTLEPVLPAVDAETIREANAEQLEAVCAYCRQPYEVSALPEGKGDYEVIGAKPLPPGTPVGVPPGKGRELSGVFHLSKYGGCPHCGASGLLLCQECGTISCGAMDKKTSQFLPCPVCGNKGQVVQSKTGWKVAVSGKGKGKKGKGV